MSTSVKFTKLRLSGFKTFVEPSEFLIERGLTGVVGPNGCGKSNLVEALRWVMGENSYKNMRASGMDDVIFSGSGRRPGRNTAEVALFLDNQTRTAPAAFNDSDHLEITRRIEREAGSNYKINGRDVRARDVQLLFADASTGSRSPAMVRQGQIGELIAAKPTSRRAILEEASGISGLHSRRNEAEIRLRAAEANLDRLEDVLTGLVTQIEGLARQARQAARYRHMSADIRATEAGVAHLKWVSARTLVSDAEMALAVADKAMAEAAQVQAVAAKDAAVAAHGLPGLREDEARAAAALQRLKLAASELDAEERRINERLAELARRLAQLVEDRAREERMAVDMADVLARLDDEAEELAAVDYDSRERAEELNDRVQSAEAALAQSERALAEVQQEAAQLEARRIELDRALAETTSRLQTLRAQAEGTAAERETLRAEIDGIRDSNEAVFLLEAAVEAVLEAEGALSEAEEAARAARQVADATRAPLSASERDVDRLDSEARTLTNMLSIDGLGLWPPIIDQISAPSGLETALGAALGDDLDASTDPAAPIHWGEPGDGAGDAALPDGAIAFSTLVTGPTLLMRRLAQLGLVKAADGPRLQRLLRPGQRLISREGDLWRWDGLKAAADAPTAAARRLGARNRLAETEVELVAARARRDQQRQIMETAKRHVESCDLREGSCRDALKSARKRETNCRDQVGKVEKALTQLTNRLSAVTEAGNRITLTLTETEARHAAVKAEISDLPPANGLAERLTLLRADVERDRAQLAEARAALAGVVREADIRQRRREAIARERHGWTDRAANAAQQMAILEARRAEAEAEKVDLIDRPDEIAAARQRLIAAIDAADKARATAADRLAEAERAQAQLDLGARTALDALAQSRETKARAEERYAALRSRRDEIEALIEETFGVTANRLSSLANLKDASDLSELDGLERKLERLKQERERLGAVNLRAEDEVNEVEMRRDALISERDDLIEAIKRLRQGIHTLNAEARGRLLAAFETVNGHFRALFTILFGGGTAELQLVESDDPLEAGLEIYARPPGKKPTTMTLLSGGEQALTALALIFAVFLTNPAPICVLDEVDAPLDDANVERYCDLLDDMVRRTETRFIVITHNPITMARMDRLYGVTMAERGVSQLVSVNLDVAERILEAS
jgi:chromosome segregation protein